jgi:hypothetical protein
MDDVYKEGKAYRLALPQRLHGNRAWMHEIGGVVSLPQYA